MKTYEHRDSLDQPIQVGQPIAFTSSYLKGVKIGTVTKLTRARVKIHYKYKHMINGQQVTSPWITLIEPKRTILLGDTLPPALTMFLLKNGL
jgi:hypothetical protein